MTAPLVAALAERLNHAGVRYCHWKSNMSLASALAGKEDLDLLVDRRCLGEAITALLTLGFKAAVIRRGRNPPGIYHYYGLDASTGDLIHVHLFSSLLTGESLVKSHRLPLEEMVLDSAADGRGIRVVSRTAELVVFILRTFIKYGSVADLVRLAPHPEGLRAELSWLKDEASVPDALRLLEEHCPVIEEPLFLDCIRSLEDGAPLGTRLLLARRMRSRLRVYAKFTPPARFLAYGQLLWHHGERVLTGKRNKMLGAGGAVIAFVGPEATGKSTLVEEARRWLGSVFAARAVHAGKPPSTWLSSPLNVGLPMLRRLVPRFRTSRLEGHVKEAREDAEPPSGLVGLAYAIRAVSVAWDRRRLLVKVRRAAANGDIVICDRYPSEVVGAMDSPRLRVHEGAGGILGSLHDRLARLEHRLYAQIPPPDVVLQLKVSLETAKRRNRERVKPGKEADAYVESRHRQAGGWLRAGVGSVREIDTEQPLVETLLCVKKAIWESL
jgi:thymidylate kinase